METDLYPLVPGAVWVFLSVRAPTVSNALCLRSEPPLVTLQRVLAGASVHLVHHEDSGEMLHAMWSLFSPLIPEMVPVGHSVAFALSHMASFCSPLP